jgi:hypothetical protein
MATFNAAASAAAGGAAGGGAAVAGGAVCLDLLKQVRTGISLGVWGSWLCLWRRRGGGDNIAKDELCVAEMGSGGGAVGFRL